MVGKGQKTKPYCTMQNVSWKSLVLFVSSCSVVGIAYGDRSPIHSWFGLYFRSPNKTSLVGEDYLYPSGHEQRCDVSLVGPIRLLQLPNSSDGVPIFAWGKGEETPCSTSSRKFLPGTIAPVSNDDANKASGGGTSHSWSTASGLASKDPSHSHHWTQLWWADYSLYTQLNTLA